MYSLIDDWSTIRSILQFMLTFEHEPMFAGAEVPVTDFQKSAVTTHPILQFIKVEIRHSRNLKGKAHQRARESGEETITLDYEAIRAHFPDDIGGEKGPLALALAKTDM